ncbi:hypothetical protein LCGC14_0529200 [marine sediment metagenome]|uniref:Uncharacterized protein n=1 Tax=marine sediment metagenome TaxID=412755 RepID=A0A0F9UHK2_9ZZZZ
MERFVLIIGILFALEAAAAFTAAACGWEFKKGPRHAITDGVSAAIIAGFALALWVNR